MFSGIWGLVSQFGITDIIDILLISFLVYRFFLIVQGTRAVQTLLGITLLLFIYWLAASFNLYSLHWLLTNFFDYFFIIIIILFQEQIRATLVTIGDAWGWFGKKEDKLSISAIEEVVLAIKAISRERIGALIVFEKGHGLLNYVSTGTPLKSKIHSDILYSIFLHRSPLHDGAVILKNNKIEAAGCFLPLSKNVDVDRHFGTRHRAALGLSEVSDAMVIVVSEETGRIQICHYGKFIPIKNDQDLRQNMREILRKSKTVTEGSSKKVNLT